MMSFHSFEVVVCIIGVVVVILDATISSPYNNSTKELLLWIRGTNTDAAEDDNINTSLL